MIPSDVLTITCRMIVSEAADEEQEENKSPEVNYDAEETVQKSEIIGKLQKDFDDLFISGEDCDATIKVQNKEFPVHSVILGARSPVFKSMFRHEMLEKVTGVVEIGDCDPGKFPDFLSYLYSGNTKHISNENVCQLYTTSDKYQVNELKEACDFHEEALVG